MLYVIAAERMIDQRCALALNVARQQLMHLSLAEFKALVRDQSFVLQLERERAVEVLASLVPGADARKELLKQVHAIVGAGDPPNAAERERLARLSQVLAAPIETARRFATAGRTLCRWAETRRSDPTAEAAAGRDPLDVRPSKRKGRPSIWMLHGPLNGVRQKCRPS